MTPLPPPPSDRIRTETRTPLTGEPASTLPSGLITLVEERLLEEKNGELLRSSPKTVDVAEAGAGRASSAAVVRISPARRVMAPDRNPGAGLNRSPLASRAARRGAR